MIIDRIENAERYSGIHPLFPRAFAALRDSKTSMLTDGRHPIEHDRIVAIPGSYVTKSPALSVWEAHRKYIDIQTVLSGEEYCGWAPLTQLTAVSPYDDEGDHAGYSGMGTSLLLRPGIFAVFFPEDGHAPGLAVADPAPVKKLVIKVLLNPNSAPEK